jgi:hypothetical protein
MSRQDITGMLVADLRASVGDFRLPVADANDEGLGRRARPSDRVTAGGPFGTTTEQTLHIPQAMSTTRRTALHERPGASSSRCATSNPPVCWRANYRERTGEIVGESPRPDRGPIGPGNTRKLQEDPGRQNCRPDGVLDEEMLVRRVGD